MTLITREMLDKKTECITIRFAVGTTYKLLTTGASLIEWKTPKGIGIIAAYRDYRDYQGEGMYLGANIGPTAGRIASGRFVLDGITYSLDKKGKPYLHGGKAGLHQCEFGIVSTSSSEVSANIVFETEYKHPIIPGTITLYIAYDLSPTTVTIRYEATASANTLLNLTNHSYFNLDGTFSTPMQHHELRIAAQKVVTVGEDMVGKDILDVAGTIFDFRKQKALLPVATDPSLLSKTAYGIDHFFMASGHHAIAELVSTSSNRRLEVSTSYPGLTVYTTNYPAKNVLSNGTVMARNGAICLETQYQSNAINDDRFETYRLEAGKKYRHYVTYRLKEE